MCNYGASFIAIFALVATLIFLTSFLLLIVRICGCQGKCRQKVDSVKKSVFWNAVINYVQLNALKILVTSCVTFRLSSDDSNIALPIGQFSLINATPVLFAIILVKKRQELDSKDTKERFGQLYKDKNVQLGYNHKVWQHSLAFFYRRTAFTLATVFAFDTPSL